MFKVQRQGSYMLRDEQLVHLSAVDLSTVLFPSPLFLAFIAPTFAENIYFCSMKPA